MSQKNCTFLFLSELRQMSNNFNKFWYVDDKVAEIVWCINIFRLTWPTSPPYLVKIRCSKLLHNDEMYYLQHLMTELEHSKLKYGLVSRVISCHDRWAQNCQNSCLKCAPLTRTQTLRRRRVSRVSVSFQESDSVVLDALGRRPVETHTKLSCDNLHMSGSGL